MKEMNVLSVFDGMSCGQIALNKTGIKYNNYFASEIDKYAIQITQKNYPETIQIGNVTKVKGKDLPKIGLLIGGSPCQGFSFAGKQLNFEDPRSKLFFEFVRLKEELDPEYFLLENVRMKQEYQDIISDYLGVKPVMINSSLVSAQKRSRFYWTNIPGDNKDLFNSSISQPIDKEIFLKDVVFDDALFGAVYQFPHGCTKGGVRAFDKSPTLTKQFHNNLFPVCMHNLYGGFNEKKHSTFIEKSPTIRTAAGGGHIHSLLLSDKALDYMNRQVKDGRNHWDFAHHSDVRNFKSAAVVANFFKGVPYNVLKDWNCIRKFDPIECERLQTVPDGYTEILDSKSYILYKNQETGGLICDVQLKDVTEKLEPIDMENSVFYITKDIKSIKVLNSLKNNQKNNVNIVIEKLGKKVGELGECVIDITKIGSDMEIPCILTKLKFLWDQEDIKNELTVKLSTGRYLRIILEENSKAMKLYIISILIKLITQLGIYSYVKDVLNIAFSIDSLRVSQDNWLKMELSDLKMESITYCSNTQRYKMLGNGWTVDVIAHIFKGLNKEETE